MEVLVIFSQKVREWEKYLEASTDINNPNWVWTMNEPSCLPANVKSEMMDENSVLFIGIDEMLDEKGVESGTRVIMNRYFGGFYSLVERWCNAEMMDEYPALREMALVGGTFLQLLADKAYSYGMDAGGVFSITRRMPRGAGGVDHPERYSLGGHTQGTAIHCSSGEFLCNPQEQQKWPQEAANGNGLTTTPNKSKQAAEGQQIGNNEPKRGITRRKGRQKKTFRELLINDADGSKLQKIHALMKGKIGKAAALVMLACVKKGWIEKPTFTQVYDEFGEIGNRQGFTNYFNEKKFTNIELDGVMNNLE